MIGLQLSTSVFLLLVFFSSSIKSISSEGNLHDVLSLSNSISEKINLFASRYVNASQLEKKFKSKKDFYKKTATEELDSLKEDLETLFATKKEELRNLSRDIRKEFDDITRESFNSNHSIFESNSLFYENIYNKIPYFGSLDATVINGSNVKIPNSVNSEKSEIRFGLTWTQNINQYLQSYKTKYIKRVYFSTVHGLVRFHPAVEWKRNMFGLEADYDSRVQPWYLGVKETPSTIIIVVDTSAAMRGESFLRAKEVVYLLLGSLSQHQRVAVIASSSTAWKKNGDYLKSNATVLGCEKDRLVRATDRNIRLLKQEVARLHPYAGSDHTEGFRLAFHLLRRHQGLNEKYRECRSNILFITGTSENSQLRCTAGFYQYSENNAKNYHSGDICHYDVTTLLNVIAILQNSLPGIKSNIFTFLTSTEYTQDDILPGQIACENNGALSRVYLNENYYDQMYAYFNYIRAREYSFDPVLTHSINSPLDGSNTVTISHAIVSQVTKRIIGVAAFDIEFSEFENILGKSHESFVFMINLYDGSTMMHPLVTKSYEHMSSRLGVPISDLEMEEGRLPASFFEVLRQMMGRLHGSYTITTDARQSFLFQNNSIVWKPVPAVNYYYTTIAGTYFGIAIKTHSLPNVSTDLQSLSRSRIMYRPMLSDITLLDEKSAVYVSPKGFCDLKDFMIQFNSNFSSLLYGFNREECVIKPLVVQDAQLTVFMENSWKMLNFSLTDIAMAYVATESGMIRIFPSISLSENDIHEPWRYSWYTEAILNPRRISCTQSPSSFTRVHDTITFSVPISACSRPDPDCFDAYGVLSVDVKRTALNRQLKDIDSSLCCLDQQSDNSSCTTKCYLFTENGEHVLSFGEPARRSTLQSMFPYIEKLLRKFKILSRRRVKTFQKLCLKNATRTISNLDDYNCVVESKSSYLDRPRLIRIGNIFGRSLVNDPCNEGYFYVTRINTTNMILLVIFDRVKLNNRNCDLYKKSMMAEQVSVEYVPCAHHAFYYKSRRNTTGCPRRRFISLPCLYSRACVHPPYPLFLIYFLVFLSLVCQTNQLK